MSKVFVSYKRVDKDKVFPFVRRLESELGIRCWVDLEGIDGDMQFTSVIINAINKCEVFLFMYSKTHETIVDTEGDYTVRELYFAYTRHKRIVFIELEPCKLPDWFDFNFPQRQVTQAYDNDATNRLVDNICKWLRLPQPFFSPISQGQATSTKDIPTGGADHQPDAAETNKSHPQAIDLGLPSGTKWASCNVGAIKPEEYGTYYAWGETEGKSYYDWSTYIHCDGDGSSCYDLGSNIAGTQYDIAYIKWGGNWQMPTSDQFKELFDYCHHKWTTLNGVKGRKFTSNLNGNSIFLPAVGYRWKEDRCYTGDNGFYWSSTPRQSLTEYAHYLYFGSSNVDWGSNCGSRFYGLMVRPVSQNDEYTCPK